MPGSKIKVLLIEDSGFMRILLSDILQKDKSIEVLATAMNGLEGVKKVKQLKPDVVITDMVMPGHDGLYVVQEIMRDIPLPVILLSSLERTSPIVFDALKEGAFDFVDKPKGNEVTEGYSRLITLIREASMIDYVKLRQRARGRNSAVHVFEATLNYDLIAIGASTGGPSAVEFVVNNLPKNLAVPVIIVQHMPERFIESFAARLAEVSGLNVHVPAHGEQIMNGHIYLTPGVSNARIERAGSVPVFKYVDTAYKEYNNPSIDCMFESVGAVYGKRAIGVILTGMGKDGTMGLKKIREEGGLTLAQDEETSVVYGMPRVAYQSGAATHKVSIKEIPNFIISAL